jgi:hypothetical protein
LLRLSRPALVRRCQRTGSVGWLAHPPLLLAASPALGLLSTMVMSLLAPGASSARAAVVPSPRARAAVKRASCLFEVSFQTGLGGIRWGAGRFDGHLVAARFLDRGGTCGLERGACLPGRSTNFDLGFCFCYGSLPKSGRCGFLGGAEAPLRRFCALRVPVANLLQSRDE